MSCQVHAANAAIEASGVPKASFDSVCVGNVLSASAVDTAYIARYVCMQIFWKFYVDVWNF